jgi:CRP-like cAMP-binding protein
MGIEDDIAVLERVPTFSVLGRDALRILAIGAENRALSTGEVLFSVGDVADAGFVVQLGAISLKEGPADGIGPTAVARSGTLLGEFALLTETTRPMTAIAVEPSKVLRITRTLFLKMLEGFPEAALRLRGHIAARASRTAHDISDVGTAIDPNPPRRK